MKIGPWQTDETVLVIAEIGNNHEGDFELAGEMLRLAAEAGAGAVKFQTIVPEKLVVSTDEARIKQLKRFQFSYKQFEELAAYARSLNVLFMSTPFDLESAEFLNTIVDGFKIASSDNNFLPLLDTVIDTEKPLIMSTGMALDAELQHTVKHIRQRQADKGKNGEVALLHCVSSYPTPVDQANLNGIRYLTDQFEDITVGYSDHTLGVDAAVLSVGLGARIIEKHFTINKNHSEFRDHQLSADPAEMAELVQRVKDAETLLGSYGKVVAENEQPVRSAARRSIAAKVDLPEGHRIQMSDLTWLRPGSGIPIGQEETLVGKTLSQEVNAGVLIHPDHLQ